MQCSPLVLSFVSLVNSRARFSGNATGDAQMQRVAKNKTNSILDGGVFPAVAELLRNACHAPLFGSNSGCVDATLLRGSSPVAKNSNGCLLGERRNTCSSYFERLIVGSSIESLNIILHLFIIT